MLRNSIERRFGAALREVAPAWCAVCGGAPARLNQERSPGMLSAAWNGVAQPATSGSELS